MLNQPESRTRFGALLVALLGCAAITSASWPFCSIGRATSDSAKTVSGNRSSTISLPAFRLGTAAGAFGYTTGIADLNGDETPDLVIADRTSHVPGRYRYRLEFAVSGIEQHDVAFESEQGALVVWLSDVDHDHDLDVVVRAAGSREVVGIWLNDGRGRFTSADVRAFPADALTLSTTLSGRSPGARSLLMLPTRRLASAGAIVVLALDSPSVCRSPFLLSTFVSSGLNARGVGPRAPPSNLALL